MKNTTQFPELADHLTHEHDSILEQWREEVAAQGEATLVQTLSRQEFYDNIPNFLEHFCARLRGDEARSTTAPARQHGAHRWQQGLSFAEIIHEWSLLHRILIERVGVLWAPAGLAAESLPFVYERLAEGIERAIETSLSEYHVRLRAQAETRARDLENALAQREHIDQARGRGLHEASHDLRGSLQVVRTCCYQLRRRALAGETGRIVERLANAGKSLNLLFSDLLDLARLEAGREQRRLSDFDAAELFNELVSVMQSSAEAKDLTLTARGQDGLTVRTDKTKLRRIAQNLILNALEYTAAGVVEVGWQANPPASWSFYVQDSGPGMAVIQQDPLAKNLEQAGRGVAETTDSPADTARETDELSDDRPDAGHGEGIGLAIVHQLCELLDAVLEIDSESERGTIFRVHLPLSYD